MLGMPEATSIAQASELRVQPIAYPLDEFYAQASRILPLVSAVNAVDLPEPARTLLVHQRDMTSTLEAFYGGPIRLEVLMRHERGDSYFREVLLFAGSVKNPVEFGAIKINLALLPASAQRAVLEEKLPFGELLKEFSIPHSSNPKAYLQWIADDFMKDVLRLSGSQLLFGRRNTLFDSNHRPMAEIIEILPHMSPPASE